jgi:hypothetical protein
MVTFTVRRVSGPIDRISALARQWLCFGNSRMFHVLLSGRLDRPPIDLPDGSGTRLGVTTPWRK